MSGQATGWVLRHGPKDRAMRAVLITIADAANRDGEHSHPGVKAMVEGSLYSRRSVFRVLEQLLHDQWIEVEYDGGGRGKATVYRIPGVLGNGAMAAPFGENSAMEMAPFGEETVPNGVGNGAKSSETVPRRRSDQQVRAPNGLYNGLKNQRASCRTCGSKDGAGAWVRAVDGSGMVRCPDCEVAS